MNSVGFVGLYIFMLAAFAGWVIIGRVPAILHTPLMSGSNFIHGIVVIGGLITSTFLSLLVIPVLFTFVDDGVQWVARRFHVKHHEPHPVGPGTAALPAAGDPPTG